MTRPAPLFGTVVLAGVGLYGVVAYGVSQRTREIGIRIALGAKTDDVTSMVVRQGVRPAIWGVVLGLGVSWIGLGALSWGQSTSLALVLGLLAGSGAVVLNVKLLEGLSKLKSTGNVRLENAVGQEGTVSIAIPEELSGSGKVSIAIQQRLMELEAITEGPGIARGRTVTVRRVSGEKLVVSTES